MPGLQECRAGVVFMRDITADGLQGQEDIRILAKAFEAPAASTRLTVVTTKWKYIDRRDAESRHKFLLNRFKKVRFHRFQQDEDAWEIVGQLLPEIEQGPVLNFEKEFASMRERKQLYEKGKLSKSNMFTLLRFTS